MFFSQFTAVKGLLVLVVFFGFVIQQYVIVEMTWPTIKTFYTRTKSPNKSYQKRLLTLELIYRALLVVVAMGFAIAIPNLDQIIPLVGVTAGMMLAFVFPATIDSITFLPGMFRKLKKINSMSSINSKDLRNQKLKIIWRIFQNTCLIILGIFGSIAGLQSSIKDLVEK